MDAVAPHASVAPLVHKHFEIQAWRKQHEKSTSWIVGMENNMKKTQVSNK